jgi:PAS domain S-box-containing protein
VHRAYLATVPRLDAESDELLAARLRLATEAAEIGTWDFDPISGELVWDARCKAAFGLPVDADVRYDVFLDALHPDDRSRTDAAVQQALDPTGAGAYDIEYRTVWPDGEIRWIRATGRGLFSNDASRRAVRFIGTVQDITDAKRAEQVIREEFDLATTLRRIGATLTSELDLNRIVQTVTDEATRISGAQFGAFFYNLTDERGESYTLYTISGVPREAFARFPMPRNTAVFEPTFRGTGIVRSDDITKDARYGRNDPHFGMPKGHLPVVSYLAVPVIARSGEVLGGLFFGHGQPNVFTERTERLVIGIASWASVAMDNARLYTAARRELEARQRSEAAAERAREAADAANRAKAEFLAAMSHELRTPLNAIAGYAQLMELGVPDPLPATHREYLGRIQRSQSHLLGLINQVLSYARLEAGRVEYDLREVSGKEMLELVEPFVRPQVMAKSLAYECVFPDSHVRVRADPEKVVQILINLVSNAVKFTPPGGRVTLSAAMADPPSLTQGDSAQRNGVVFRVADTGMGIPAERLEDIFDPFVQVNGTLTREEGGAGLGLSISRDLARGMGGELTAVSTLGGGSVFSLVLPSALSAGA